VERLPENAIEEDSSRAELVRDADLTENLALARNE
jgi:hypothetical protein